jgi:putative nucleotidyltransferase with HDIG domain
MPTIVKDPVHGLIELTPLALSVIDTPEFQRLRGLRQLGNVHYVYPGANHTRFEHSLGVYHLATLLCRHLQLPAAATEAITIAALLHDVGHGPFSHLYEEVNVGFNHEKNGAAIIERLLPDAQFAHTVGYILHHHDECLLPPYYRQIVANHETGMDVDRIDYLMRDAYHCGKPLTFEPHRIIQSARVIHGTIAFAQKDAFILFQMYAMRYAMFRQVYMHPVSRAIDLMTRDAFDAALESGVKPRPTDSDEQALMAISAVETSRRLLERIVRRQLYKECTRHVADIRDSVRLDLGFGDENPLRKLAFYTKEQPQEFHIGAPADVSFLIPQQGMDCSDKWVRFYNRQGKSK